MTLLAEPITGYYLDQEVLIVEDLGDGWVACEWQNDRAAKGRRIFRHWRDQVMSEPFGKELAWPREA